MTDPVQIADDILDSLLAMDGVDEVELIMHGIDSISSQLRDKFIDRIKEDYELIAVDEAAEHIDPPERPED